MALLFEIISKNFTFELRVYRKLLLDFTKIVIGYIVVIVVIAQLY